MADIVDRLSVMPGFWVRRSIHSHPVLWAWLFIAVLLGLCWCAGISPNGDFDDILKLMQIRAYLETGSWFDRTIPGVLQPEPFASHWPRILDLPYAAVAWLLAPFAGRSAALATAVFAVPLLLLPPALASFRRILAGLGFERPNAAFFLALVPALGTLFEFVPGRIDYHNVQIVALLAAIALTLMRSAGASMVGGAIIALALATSTEFALFFALVMAIHVAEFVKGDEAGSLRLGALGVALGVTAVFAYAIVVAPDSYSRVACDTYSPPHLLGLVLAGASFVAAAGIGRRFTSPFVRASAIVLPGIATAVLLAVLFPQCLGGPYAALGTYLRDVFLGDIGQEQSLFARSDFVLSGNMFAATLLFVGATAPAVIVIADRFRDRNLLIVALFALLAMAQAVLYFRYFRYVPILAAPGLILLSSALAPGLRAKGALLAGRLSSMLPSPTVIAAPGLIVSAGLIVFHLAAQVPDRILAAATFAGSCDLNRVGHYSWPQGSRVMAPPLVDIMLLPDMQPGTAVIAVPYHTGGVGVERAYRFLDPATADPRLPLDASLATHVAICALPGKAPVEVATGYPFATLLMEGRAPNWLTECPTGEQASIRIYRYAAGGAAGETCPAPR
jgi:hypothetical protein